MKPFKIAVVGLPGNWSTEILADEIAAVTGFRMVIDLHKVAAELSPPCLHYQGQNLCELDAVIIKKISATYSPNVLDRLEMLRLMESCGVRVYSKPSEIIRLVNRMSGSVSLARAQIPMPKTCMTEDPEAALKAVHHYGEAILKPLFSTKARGMQVLRAGDGDSRVREQLGNFYAKHRFFYIQQKLQLPGHDLGLVFLNGVYQGAYARIAHGNSWNTTIEAGGNYARAEPSAQTIELAQRAQAQFKLSFCTVDMAETEAGPVCFEVSAFGGFKGAHEGLGLNMANAYCHFVLTELMQERYPKV
ncbi:MAG: GAK system ATP-grasp enzyme [Thiotrichales bacterium]|nr:GAK system ATP-grasp enzyme [Thiotrichales bacterium]